MIDGKNPDFTDKKLNKVIDKKEWLYWLYKNRKNIKKRGFSWIKKYYEFFLSKVFEDNLKIYKASIIKVSKYQDNIV